MFNELLFSGGSRLVFVPLGFFFHLTHRDGVSPSHNTYFACGKTLKLHQVVQTDVPWYSARNMRGASLGSLIVLCVLRCLGHNLSR